MISIVVAMNPDYVIGVDNQLPWHIPEDLQHFKQCTMGKPIIMGRKTFESIGRILPGRKNIIISRNSNYNMTNNNNFAVYSDLNAAILDNEHHPELCIIGGGEIFKLALPLVNKIYLTIVELPIANPTVFFPKLDMEQWQIICESTIITATGVKCHFKELLRINYT
jgi:dihydrofolate reductase